MMFSKKSPPFVSLDANEAVGSVAFRMSDLIAIYPITPSTPMGEWSDEWSSKEFRNVWGHVPRIVEMQSEAGVAGAIHGMLQGGTLATTFTASQGLLLMIPILYKIAGQLMPFCLHVTARSLATHALSIFGDHSDVMAVRQTGFAMLCSSDTQEAQDMACIAHAATLASRIPFLHFFDGFRTSHEINSLLPLGDNELRAMIDPAAIAAHAARALTPDRPSIRGTAHNPDTYFQAREAVNPYYDALPGIVRETMAKFAEVTGRRYEPFAYHGHPEAEKVIVLMGSGAQTASETARHLNADGAKVGVLQIRLYRPFDAAGLVEALPPAARHLAVLDRTKEPGAPAEPLHLDVIAALSLVSPRRWLAGEAPRVVGGRYGLSSKEFTPAMVKAVYDSMETQPAGITFTVGITDDVSRLSLEVDQDFHLPMEGVTQAVFFGLGSDGTVGANKNTIKIISKKTGAHAQAYFVYDSKKSGAVTVSHLRFGHERIRAPYLVEKADFAGCHQFHLLEQQPILEKIRDGGILLVNSPYGADDLWSHLSREAQETIIERKIRVHAIDAYRVAREAGLGARINTIMQTCFFALSNILPVEQAIEEIKEAIRRSYSRKGTDVVERNCAAVDQALSNLSEIKLPGRADAEPRRLPFPADAPDFVRDVTFPILLGRGDLLPVSAFPPDGTWPTATSRWEKRTLAREIPAWNSSICIQCNKCVLVCPHAAIRAKHYPEAALAGAPDAFKSVPFRSTETKGDLYTIQIAPQDCTGCRLCAQVCPAKDKSDPKVKALNIIPIPEPLGPEIEAYDFFLRLPEVDRSRVNPEIVKETQFLQPLFEYSGACAGCGETPYIKLLTQLYGERAIIANATGCSSIYGGNLPTTPYACTTQGRGPAWANSLFEDNAEFGLGMRLAADSRRTSAEALVLTHAKALGEELVAALIGAPQSNESEIAAQRARIAELRGRLAAIPQPDRDRLAVLADDLVRKSVWIVGGDGWAYDIGFGGLDHVLSLGEKVNILVLDTEVYSNTGGQQSKSTATGAVAKFAASGKEQVKKDLGLIAMAYGNVYVARVALGAKDSQTVKAFTEAEAFPGTSLIIAYSHCIAHGYNLVHGLDQQKLAVETGYWPLYRFDPRRKDRGENPLVMDSAAPKQPLERFTENEIRYRALAVTESERAKRLAAKAQRVVNERYDFYSRMASTLTKE